MLSLENFTLSLKLWRPGYTAVLWELETRGPTSPTERLYLTRQRGRAGETWSAGHEGGRRRQDRCAERRCYRMQRIPIFSGRFGTAGLARKDREDCGRSRLSAWRAVLRRDRRWQAAQSSGLVLRSPQTGDEK